MLTEKDEMMCRWREHFSELLGSEQEEEDVIGEDLSRGGSEDRSEWLAEITREEIRKGVGKLKKGKAEGICGISGELLKAGGEVVIEWLSWIYSMVWKEWHLRTGRELSCYVYWLSIARLCPCNVATTCGRFG